MKWNGSLQIVTHNSRTVCFKSTENRWSLHMFNHKYCYMLYDSYTQIIYLTHS